MLFNSFEYLVFFPVVAGLYFCIGYFVKAERAKICATQVLLLTASLFFYACWNPAYLALIVTSVVITWLSGILMEKLNHAQNGESAISNDFTTGRMGGGILESGLKNQTHSDSISSSLPASSSNTAPKTDSVSAKKKLILTASLILNLAILFFFKYFNFFADSVSFIARATGYQTSFNALDVLLPVGISFYTFQALGYSIDVYRGTVRAERNFITYALFVTFFPQLVAGPIERTENLLPQFKKVYPFDYERVTDGLRLAAWGMVKKVVIADNLAVYVNAVYNNLGDVNGCAMLLATFFFAFQILCDFSGYCDIAIGCANVMGFKLMRNFDHPYFARSIAEFWRRWHISLSTWFKDYVYIPLGGNRVKISRRYFNLIVTFLVSGLWHGAAWHFVIWGLLHGVYQVIGIATAKPRAAVRRRLHIKDESRVWKCVQILITFCLVCFAWIFFRANTMGDAVVVVKGILGVPREVIGITTGLLCGADFYVFGGFVDQFARGLKTEELLLLFVKCSLLITVDFITRKKSGLAMYKSLPVAVRWIGYYSIVADFLIFNDAQSAGFIYFQF